MDDSTIAVVVMKELYVYVVFTCLLRLSLILTLTSNETVMLANEFNI